MRRKDREICDWDEILDVLERCDTLRVGMVCDGQPYIVPVSFGVQREGGALRLYFHGAPHGRKAEWLRDGAPVCVEGDLFYKAEATEHGITARYESVIGFGTVVRAVGAEKAEGLRRIVEHYGFLEYPAEGCAELEGVVVYRVAVERLTGKRNLRA